MPNTTLLENIVEMASQSETKKHMNTNPLPDKSVQESYIKELPGEILTTESISESGLKSKKVVKKRVILKKTGDKQEITEIQTIQQDDKRQLVSVQVKQVADGEILEASIEELPEQTETVESTSEKGIPTKTVVKKRIIKKKKGTKQEITEIQTVQRDDEIPIMTVDVQENEITKEEPQKAATIENVKRCFNFVVHCGKFIRDCSYITETFKN